MYKDIYNQERRFRFRLSESPNCLECGGVEMVEHQMFECKNATRFWNIYNMIFRETITFDNFILANSNQVKEVVKAVITRLLVQIDRSKNVSIHQAFSQIRHALTIESLVTRNEQFKITINQLDNLFL